MLLFIEQLWLFEISRCCIVPLYSSCCKRSKRKILAALYHLSSQQKVSGPGFATTLYTESLNPVAMSRQNRANPSWHARHLEHHLSTNSIYHQSFDPWFLLSAPIISAEALCYRLISKPGAREVNLILLLLLLANKRGVKEKTWEMEEEFMHLFVVETDDKKTGGGGGRECKATGMMVVIGARVSWSFPWWVCLNFSCLKVA